VPQYFTSQGDPQGLLKKYDMAVMPGSPPELVGRIAQALKALPEKLIKDCGIRLIGFQDLGPSREYYPNHGLYVNNKLILNSQLIDDPTVYVDGIAGKKLEAFDHILYHEMGHGWDMVKGELSLKPEWLNLSGWVEDPTSGKVRIIIRDKDVPEPLVGEWYYTPGTKFVRYYARRNPWDDFADTFAFVAAGMRGFIPDDKFNYFDEKIKAST
jgi:hypothetical protein